MTPTTPNIVLIHWHDTGRHLGTYGVEGVRSPNVDRLAAQGTRFDRAFATAPLCSPARGSLFTGRYPHNNGLMGLAHQGWEYNTNERTLPMLLRGSGYHTTLVGLQHESSDPTTLGYDEVIDLNAPGQRAPAVAELARDRLQELAATGSPFLMVIGMTEPHRPFPATRFRPGPASEVQVPPYLDDTDDVREDLAGFVAAISYADEATGRVLETIEASGLNENTVVVFTTDHGIPFPRAKSTLYDAGIEVALVVRMPSGAGVPGSHHDGMVSHVDIVPTLLELAGAEVPRYVQGGSFAEVLRGPGRGTSRATVYAEKNWHGKLQYDPVRCVRTERYKYIHSFEERPAVPLPSDIAGGAAAKAVDDDVVRDAVELYDLWSDPHELDNLAGTEEVADVEAELSADLLAWRRQTHDPLLLGPVEAPRTGGSSVGPHRDRTRIIEPQFVQRA